MDALSLNLAATNTQGSDRYHGPNKNRENDTAIHIRRTLLCLGNLRALLLRCPMEAFQRRCPVSILCPESLQRRRGNSRRYCSFGARSRITIPRGPLPKPSSSLQYVQILSMISVLYHNVSVKRLARGNARVRRECKTGNPARAGRELWPSGPARWRRGIPRHHA